MFLGGDVLTNCILKHLDGESVIIIKLRMPRCAVKTCRNRSKTGAGLSFHRLPVREPERLTLWLSALNIDVNTPVDELQKRVVCSEHFVPEDYSVRGQQRTNATRSFLTPTAVPTVGVSSTPPGVTQVEQIPVLVEAEIQEQPHVRQELVYRYVGPGVESDASNGAEVQLPKSEPTSDCELSPPPAAVTDSGKNQIKDESMDCHSSEDTQELLPSLHHCGIKVEQIPVLEEAEIQEQPHVRQELVDRCVGPDVEFDASNGAEVQLPKSEPTSDCELSPPPAAVTDSGKNRIKDESMDCHSSEDTQELLPSLHHCGIKMEQIPVLEEAEIQEQPHVRQELVDWCVGPDMEFDASNGAEVRLPKSEPTSDCELSPPPAAVTDSGKNRIKEESMDCHSSEDTQELLPSLHHCGIKVEQITVLEEAEIQEQPHVRQELVDRCVGPDVESDASNGAEVQLPESEPTSDCELSPPPAAVTVSVNESLEERNKSDGSSSSPQSHSIEVYVNLEEPPREEKTCRFCGKSFKKDSFLIRHVDQMHNGKKAFKCLKCKKEFEQRYQLVLHVRIHTGEKPFSCDYCDKTFVQNSSRLVHMRVHTGEKPYFCAKCGKSFATSNHFRLCKVQNESEITQDKGNADEEKAFKCSDCNKEFNQRHQLALHARIHSGKKRLRCEFCGKTFLQNSNRIVHMRQHTGEKPYYCEKCGKRFASSHHLKLCSGKQKKGIDKSFRCATCGRTFRTESDLKVHAEVHMAWKRHLSEKLQGQEQQGET